MIGQYLPQTNESATVPKTETRPRPVRWSDTTLLAVEAKTPDLVSS